MKPDPQPKRPLKKDAEYMRKAYLYTAILFVIAGIGAKILAFRIIQIESMEEPAAIEEIEAEEDE